MLILKSAVKAILYAFIGLLGYTKYYVPKSQRCDIYIIGDLYSESGLGNVTRAIIASLGEDISYKLINLPLSIESKQGGYDIVRREVKKLGPGVSIFVGNPSVLVQALLKLDITYLISNYTIGVWFWELERIPNSWKKVGRLVDEVWAQSDFAANAFAVSNQKTKVMPFALSTKPDFFFDRNYFSIPDDKFIFIMTFDYLSHVARKNPDAVIRAFIDEFEGDSSVMLVIKSVNSEKFNTNKDELLVKARVCENIVFIDDYLTKHELLSLIKVVDCYVSLHRSEGLGLGLAEAMSLGTMVIGTGYSGNMQYMTSENSLLVDYALVPVRECEYPYAKGNFWAEPSLESARTQMRYAISPENGREARIAKAKASIERYDFNYQRAWLMKNLGEI